MSAVAERLGQAVAAVLTGLAWGSADDPPSAIVPTVKVRKRPEVTQQDGATAAKPVVVVCTRRGTTELVWAGTVVQSYTVGVYVFAPSPVGLGPTDQFNGWVEMVRKAIHGTGAFTGVPESNEVVMEDQLPYDPPSLDKNWVVGTVGFRFEAIEPRS